MNKVNRRYLVTVVISKEVTRIVKATSEREAVRKVKANLAASPPKLRPGDYSYLNTDHD